MYRRSFSLFHLLVAVFCISLAPATTASNSLGRGCSVFKPCDSGFSCQPGVHKCYHSPRREGQPCSLGFECGSGLTCEAGSQVCRGGGEVGDACHATRPCGSGLTCQPGVHRCYHSPRQEGEPCVAGFPCGNGLHCEAGAQVCRKAVGVGDACHATRPCGEGLSCQPGIHKCYHSPRRVTDPCSAGFECGKGLVCQAFSQRCFPGDFSWSNRNSCLSVRDEAIANEAKRSGITTTYGAGSAQTAFAISMSEEIGVVYGSQGEYGCYFTTCGGFVSDLSISAYGAVGEYESYSVVAGDAEVYAGGASPPILEIGGGSIAVVVSRDFSDSSVPHKVVGSVQTLGIGVGILPGQAAALRCHTDVNDVLGVRGVPVSNEVVAGENLDCVRQAFERFKDWEQAFLECAGTNTSTVEPGIQVTAAFTLYNGATYLFHPDGTYSKASKSRTGIDSDYPAKMPGGWKGLSSSWYSGINAALPYQGTSKSYMFKDGSYARLTGVTIDSGYPAKMPGGWQNMPTSWNGQVDAALYYQPNDRHYMFKGNEYVRLTGVKVDSGYPAKLPGGWSGMPAEFAKGIDAATYRNGHVYMFKGEQYIRFTGTRMDSGYPKLIKGNWAE